MSRTMTYTRICKMCGVRMENVGASRMFCDTCIRRRDNLAHQEKERQTRVQKAEEVPLPKRTPYKKPTKENTLESVCARARAAGRTYGQQVEYERRQKELKERGEID